MKDTEIENYLNILTNKPIIDIGRASNMLWLGIGELIKTIDHKGNNIETSSISLHVQSAWRLRNKEKKEILFASSDMYEPKSTIEWTKDFEWDIQGNNLFDEKSKVWLCNNKNIYIKEYGINQWGDLILLFSNDDVLEIFIDTSDNTECWRLFEYNSSRDHFVVTGEGVVFEYED